PRQEGRRVARRLVPHARRRLDDGRAKAQRVLASRVPLMADRSSRQGARYATPDVLDWLDGVHAAHDAPLARAFAAPDREGMPAIQVGPSEGRLLELLARLIAARRAVEIGTLAGY